MKILGIILIVLAYMQGITAMFYFGILPAIGGIWTWGDYGLSLVMGLVGCTVFYLVGQALLLLHSRRLLQKADKIEIKGRVE